MASEKTVEATNFCKNIYDELKPYKTLWDKHELYGAKGKGSNKPPTAFGSFAEELLRKYIVEYLSKEGIKLYIISGVVLHNIADKLYMSRQIDLILYNKEPQELFGGSNGLIDVSKVKGLIEIKKNRKANDELHLKCIIESLGNTGNKQNEAMYFPKLGIIWLIDEHKKPISPTIRISDKEIQGCIIGRKVEIKEEMTSTDDIIIWGNKDSDKEAYELNPENNVFNFLTWLKTICEK